MSATTETATLTISTRAANPDDGHTAAEDRQWDRIRAAAGRCGVRLCGSDWSEDGRRETNRVEGDARAVRKFERAVLGRRVRGSDPLGIEVI